MSYSRANATNSLMKYSKESIIAEIHNTLGPQQINQLITNLESGNHQQSDLTATNIDPPSPSVSTLYGDELNAAVDEMITKLNMQKRRDSIQKWSDTKKQEFLAMYYEKTLLNNTPSVRFAKSPNISEYDTESVASSMMPPTHGTRMNRFDTMCEVPKSNQILHEGWMSIQTNTKNWKKRWFALYQNNALIYYKKTDEKKDQKGNVSLYELSKIKTKKIGNGFKIDLMENTKVVAHLKLEKENDFITWRDLLESRINPKAVFEGFAEKKSGSGSKGKKNGSWNKRYFKLVRFAGEYTEIRYYEEAKMSKIKKFKGMIDIANVAKVQMLIGKKAIDKYGKKRTKLLEIVTSKKIYVLSFEVMADCIKCKEALEQSMTLAGLPVFGGNNSNLDAMTTDDDAKETSSVTTDSKNNEIVSNDVQEVTPAPPNDDEKEKGDNEEEEEEQYEEQESDDDFDLDVGDDAMADNPNIMALPPGWMELEDANGTPYYHNEQTGVTQWEKPEY